MIWWSCCGSLKEAEVGSRRIGDGNGNGDDGGDGVGEDEWKGFEGGSSGSMRESDEGSLKFANDDRDDWKSGWFWEERILLDGEVYVGIFADGDGNRMSDRTEVAGVAEWNERREWPCSCIFDWLG